MTQNGYFFRYTHFVQRMLLNTSVPHRRYITNEVGRVSLNKQTNEHDNSTARSKTTLHRSATHKKKNTTIKNIQHFLKTVLHKTKRVMAVIMRLFTGSPLPTAIKLIHDSCSVFEIKQIGFLSTNS